MEMDLINSLKNLGLDFEKAVNAAATPDALEDLRIEYLGRKGKLAEIMSQLPKLDPSLRPAVGQKANEIKVECQQLFEAKKGNLAKESEARTLSRFDPTLPGREPWQGSLHPVSLVIREVCGIFGRLGFDVASGPEVEIDRYNFEALNMPPEHPARDMQDSLYITDSTLLRTHTSPVQVRTMLARRPPIAIVAPGKVYRRDSDLTHTPMFHQIEGLMVGKDITMAHLRGLLQAFIQNVFGRHTKIRFRPSFFPFTEPSAEVDISCMICGGKGEINGAPCRVCKGTGWLEILGCGMVDPNVYESVGYAGDISGFAFGMGIERIAMLKYGINDLRIFFQNDTRFLEQFGL